LRLQDNSALSWALHQGMAVLPVYLHSPQEEAPWQPGAASRWWLHHSLSELSAQLRHYGLRLRCYRGDALRVIPDLLAADPRIRLLVANRLYEPHLHQRDQRLLELLQQSGEVQARLFDGHLLFHPASLLNRQGKAYRVFTPFWRVARGLLEQTLDAMPQALPAAPWPAAEAADPGDGDDGLDGLGLLDDHPWHQQLAAHWRPGEEAALQRLQGFLAGGLADYRSRREFPAQEGSSRLSPHLHFGEISIRRVARAALLQPRDRSGLADSLECFLSELGWREFAHHVLWHFPQCAQQPLNPRFPEAFWGWDEVALAAWQRGRTGIDLIDAGMRELWQSGWMHNRVRMLVGSLLTKNLGVHWLAGARWFWDTLVDADLAANSLGWQWIAGCGVDAAPYFRIFNPETQAAKFDAEGVYARRWLAGRKPVAPILDLAESRRQALARYRSLPGRQSSAGDNSP
jgi:deoxyribodipyrimidine photo-lyase